MSERYTRLYALTENLYSAGAPVIIAAGALQKDNETGKVFAQIKFRSISVNGIKAVKLKIVPLDTVGKPIGGEFEYQYLDLAAHRDTEFGAKVPVPIADVTTRSFSAAVGEVVFTDNTVWAASGAAWEPLSAPVSLENSLNDAELAKQYRLKFGTSCKYIPSEQKDLWTCACGALNHESESVCHSCGGKLAELKAIDFAALKEERDARIATETQKAAENKAAAAKAGKVKKFSLIGGAAAIIIAFVIVLTQVIIPSGKYSEAEKLLANGDYFGAVAAFEALGNYKDAPVLAQDALNAISRLIAAGGEHTVGLKRTGVVAVGNHEYEQLDVSDWRDVIAVYAGYIHTVGLKSDGTVVAVGNNEYEQLNVSDWRDIVAVSAGAMHTVGLKSNGRVIAVGDYEYEQLDMSDWRDIIAISAGYIHTVGLKADGRVVAVGNNEFGQLDVYDWRDIIAVSAGGIHTVGLKSDGTVVAVGNNEYEQLDVSDWRDIIAVSAGAMHTVGLKADGTVVAVGNNEFGQLDVSDWRDIIAVSAGGMHTVGLKADGTVVAVGNNETAQCDVSDWHLW
jgi:hypothetical protein